MGYLPVLKVELAMLPQAQVLGGIRLITGLEACVVNVILLFNQASLYLSSDVDGKHYSFSSLRYSSLRQM
jgi:hypothetical protein